MPTDLRTAEHVLPLPDMPQIGLPESQYARMARRAERDGNRHSHAAAKVGQYLTLALDRNLTWEQKIKYFQHALLRHCHPPPFPEEEVWMFYHALADCIRRRAGEEALRMVCQEDDQYANRLKLGQNRNKIEEEAEIFFARFIPQGDECPEWFNREDFAQIKVVRDQWI